MVYEMGIENQNCLLIVKRYTYFNTLQKEVVSTLVPKHVISHLRFDCVVHCFLQKNFLSHIMKYGRIEEITFNNILLPISVRKNFFFILQNISYNQRFFFNLVSFIAQYNVRKIWALKLNPDVFLAIQIIYIYIYIYRERERERKGKEQRQRERRKGRQKLTERQSETNTETGWEKLTCTYKNICTFHSFWFISFPLRRRKLLNN